MAGQIERARVFVRVAELGSFAEAARSLGMARSVVTRQVSELEDTLGVQLLVRTTRKVSMTQAGQIYLARMRPVLAEIERVDELVSAQHGTLAGEFRLSAPVSFGMRFLPGALTEFQRRYPEIVLKVELSDRFVDILTENFDMALRISGPPADVSTIWRKLARMPRLIVASPGYLAAAGPIAHPDDLARHRILAYSHFTGAPVWRLAGADGQDRIFQVPPGNFESDNGDLIVKMALQDGGLTLMPQFLLDDHLETGRLVQVLTGWSAPDVWITAFCPPYIHLPEKVRAFTEFLERALTTTADRAR